MDNNWYREMIFDVFFLWIIIGTEKYYHCLLNLAYTKEQSFATSFMIAKPRSWNKCAASIYEKW